MLIPGKLGLRTAVLYDQNRVSGVRRLNGEYFSSTTMSARATVTYDDRATWLRSRQKVDEKAAAALGGWSDLNLMRNTHTHAEDTEIKINQALNRGLRDGEHKTTLKLRTEP